MTFSETALPSRIVVGQNGAYWRDFGTHYSMAVVSSDNEPVVPVATYVREAVTEHHGEKCIHIHLPESFTVGEVKELLRSERGVKEASA